MFDGNFVAMVIIKSSLVRDLDTSCNLDKESFMKY